MLIFPERMSKYFFIFHHHHHRMLQSIIAVTGRQIQDVEDGTAGKTFLKKKFAYFLFQVEWEWLREKSFYQYFVTFSRTERFQNAFYLLYTCVHERFVADDISTYIRISVKLMSQFKIIFKFEFPVKPKPPILQKPWVIQASPSDSHLSDQQRSRIWGKPGQNKSPVFVSGEGRCISFLKILNCDVVCKLFILPPFKTGRRKNAINQLYPNQYDL